MFHKFSQIENDSARRRAEILKTKLLTQQSSEAQEEADEDLDEEEELEEVMMAGAEGALFFAASRKKADILQLLCEGRRVSWRAGSGRFATIEQYAKGL